MIVHILLLNTTEKIFKRDFEYKTMTFEFVEVYIPLGIYYSFFEAADSYYMCTYFFKEIHNSSQ